MTLNFIFKCKPLIINCVVKEKHVEFQYATETRLRQHPAGTKSNSFSYLGTLETHNFEVYSAENSLFNFYLANTTDNLDKNLSGDSNKLNCDLYKVLFTNNFVEKFTSPARCPPVLIIGGNDGYIYWKPLDSTESTSQFRLNEHILLNASSPVIYISSCKIPVNQKNNFDDLFNSSASKKASKTTQNTADNCLFALTRSGRLHLFVFINEYEHKVCVIPHYIRQCIKFKHGQPKNQKDYLVYLTKNSQVFAIQLEKCLKSEAIQPQLLKNYCEIKRFFIGKYSYG